MREIAFRKHTILLDERDFKAVSSYKLTTDTQRGLTHALVILPPNRKVRLHRHILNIDDRKTYVEAINGNYLDCRRENLRTVHVSESVAWQKTKPRRKAPFIGLNTVAGKYRVIINLHERSFHLGYFPLDQPEDAARCYDRTARWLGRPLNFPARDYADEPLVLNPCLVRAAAHDPNVFERLMMAGVLR